jgi:hypothetical protein
MAQPLSRRSAPPHIPFKAKRRSDFCRAWRMSRSKFYELRKQGLTPEELDLDGLVLITDEAEEKWKRERIAASRAAAKTEE